MIFRKIISAWKKRSNQRLIKKYRRRGISIGENCCILSRLPMTRDCILLSIGNGVIISSGVAFFCHDSSIIIPSGGRLTDVLGPITIGDRCFIGHGSIILPGVFLSEGTIVGSGSVVTKSVMKKNMVVGGNPAHYICSTEEYLEKNRSFAYNLNGKNQIDLKNEINGRKDILHRPEMII